MLAADSHAIVAPAARAHLMGCLQQKPTLCGRARGQACTSPMIPTIRLASSDDAASLAELAARTFRDTFGADNRPEDLALHLASSYGPLQQARELADPGIITLVAEAEGSLVAFAQLRRGAPPAAVVGPAPIELWRFYLASDWHGRGLAQRLMARVVNEARSAGAATLWLGVWERNPRAIAFYRKAGYAEVGTHVFVVGRDPQTDRIMTRALAGMGAA